MQRQDAKKIFFDNIVNNLRSNDPIFESLVLKNIEYHNDNQEQHLAELVDVLHDNTSLKYLSIDISILSKLNCSEEMAISIGKALKDHPNLSSLEICTEKCDTASEKIILGLLTCLTGNAQLTHLKINLILASNSFFKEFGYFLLNKRCLQHLSITVANQLIDHASHQEVLLTDVQTICLALSRQNQLRECILKFPKLDELGEIALSNALVTIKNLDKLELQYYEDGDKNSQLNAAIKIFLINNPALCELNLALKCETLEPIITTLCSLPMLKTLHLLNQEFSTSDFQLLCNNWQKWRLTISDLSLADHRTLLNDETLNRDEAMNSIINLIDGNTSLKSLCLDFSVLSIANALSLRELLSNPDRCKLYSLYSDTGFNMNEKEVLSIASKNKNFMKLNMISKKVPGLPRVIDMNKRKHYDEFLCEVMLVCQGFFAKEINSNWLTLLPKEIFLKILSYIITGRVYQVNHDYVDASANLIFNNFERRYHEEEALNKSSSGSADKVAVSAWWQQSIFYNNKEREIFKTREIEPKKRIFNFPCAVV